MTDYNKIRTLCDECGIAKGKQTDEYLFTLNAVDLFYHKRNIGQIDIKSNFTDGANDGGIDYIYGDVDTMYLVQGKSSTSLSLEDIDNVFTKMIKTISRFDEGDTDGFSTSLKSAYRNSHDLLSDEKNIELVLFTNTIIDDHGRKHIADFAKSEVASSYKITVYDANDIQYQTALLNTNSELISNDKINIFCNGNNDMLAYGEDGVIVNVMASSIKILYEKYGKTGLFSYNLREFISQKSVDDGIKQTIKQEKDKFWFYNNGITIGCRDFYKDGNVIKLYDFSIINGAQTSTQIGQSKIINEKYDFAIVCKIVKSNDRDVMDQEFIGKISEASNSQKPVKQRDLKANAREQIILQDRCASNEKYALAIEIKRGVKPNNYKKVEKWQRVTNEFIGQLIYGCILQHPGPARNSKHIMFSSAKLYKEIFRREHDCNTLYDLVRLASIYDKFSEDYIGTIDDADKIALIKNGKLAVLAITLYLYKKKVGIIKNFNSESLHKDNIKGLLITNYTGDDLEQKLTELFKLIIKHLDTIYQTKKTDLKITSYSNFFKSDPNYEIICKYLDDLDDYDKKKIDYYMEVFSFSK